MGQGGGGPATYGARRRRAGHIWGKAEEGRPHLGQGGGGTATNGARRRRDGHIWMLDVSGC
eukprot:3498656-Prymnesium_polylepis.1